MLKQLRRRLTLICAAVSGAILLAMALCALSITHQQWNRRNEADFARAAAAVRLRLTTDTILTGNWLSQNEVSQRLIIFIEDNGKPLLWRGAWTPATDRGRLAELARQKAAGLGMDFSQRPAVRLWDREDEHTLTFMLRGDHADEYRAYVYQLSRGEKWLTLTLLQDTAPQNAQLRRMNWLFLGAAVAGIALMGLFSWWFAGRAILPVEQAQQRQTRFVADASHELRSPLAVIRLSAQAMAQADAAQAEAFRNTIETEAAHMSRLVEDLLLLAHADAGQWAMRQNPLEPGGIISQAYDHNLILAREKGQLLQMDVPASLPLVAGDEGYLNQALNILIQNATDHTPPQGGILLKAQAIPAGVRISVANTGPAIAREDLPHVFDRFYRASKARTRDGHYGLGLSIAKAIVTAHGGQIRARNLEDGCVFEIDLPPAKI